MTRIKRSNRNMTETQVPLTSEQHTPPSPPPPPSMQQAVGSARAATAATQPTDENTLHQQIHQQVISQLQDQFSQICPTNISPSQPEGEPPLSPEVIALIRKIISENIMQIQPIIMTTVSSACSKILSIMLGEMRQSISKMLDEVLKKNPQQNVQIAPPQTTQPDNALMADMRKQLRQQHYQRDQYEQEDREDAIWIKGVNPVRDEDIYDTVIDVAGTIDVALRPEDISNCFRIGTNASEPHKRHILVKLAHKRKKVALMINKKKLGEGRFIEEDLTRLRSKLYHTVRREANTLKTWTQDGKVFTIIKDLESRELKKILTTPDDLVKIGWNEERICKFWEEYNA